MCYARRPSCPVGIRTTGLALFGWFWDYKLGAFPPWMGRVRVGYSLLRKGFSGLGLTPHPCPLPKERGVVLKSLRELLFNQHDSIM